MAAPKYIQTFRSARASIATANANRDGTGTVGTVITGVAAGTQVDRMRITALSTTTAGMIRIFEHDGTNYTLIDEVPIPAWVPSATLPTLVFTWFPRGGPLLLPSTSHSLRASTERAETFHLLAEGGDL